MIPHRLRDIDFKISYGAGDDRLEEFYIPALSCSNQYDRSTGFFSSAALAVAATGVAHLIRNGGRMRLLVGAELLEEDVEAIRRGHELGDRLRERLNEALVDPENLLVRQRLEALAWMVARGTLDIRVVLPRGPDGHPLPADQARDYYHPKEGIFTDSSGDQVAFSGSINESAAGWVHNYEQFSVYLSWNESRPYLAQVAHRFERLWRGDEPYWLAVPVPEAVRQRLLRFCPPTAPEVDPLVPRERRSKYVQRQLPASPQEQRERILFQFVRDAPYLPNADHLGLQTSVVKPWPHQRRVVEQLAERFPERFLLADEVGLGKTIEAGLALRQLVLSGRVSRCLLLVPKSVARQWQEELYEKFLLNVPFYDGFRVTDVFRHELIPAPRSPWNAYPLLLASSQLAKRRDRQPEVLGADPWDLVIVDEAHHARRREFFTNRYRPNRLLQLLEGLRSKTKGLWLLTATPMQMHPVEVWDLLRLLGLAGRWGADEEHFLRYFQELRQPYDEIDWEFLLGMMRDFLQAGGSLDPFFSEQAERAMGLVDWQRLRDLPLNGGDPRFLRHLDPQHRPWAVEMVRRHTPLRRLAFRNTRSLLREYARRGLLRERVPKRDPRPEWITMGPMEEALYHRIEEYISDFYSKYEQERKGLGFVMTVYRRRLTSSFYALQQSLERRLRFLRGDPTVAPHGLDDDDLEQQDLSEDITEELAEGDRRLFRGEIRYVEDFLRDLRRLGPDSKVGQLLRDLTMLLRERDSAVVFTQYTDTMEFLREQIRQVYGSQVACYSGRGGEYWTGDRWELVSKEEIKEAFRDGSRIRILVCTEAASEGINLQTCGILINYDMPWNPMRVEQRIGRLDRIGQRYEVVWVRNYFYEGTVEAIVYQRLGDRIQWFEEVVGELQPILTRVAAAIETLAVTPSAERQRRLEEEIARIRRELEAREVASVNFDEYFQAWEGVAKADTAPLVQRDLQDLILTSSALRGRFRPHPEIPGAYLFSSRHGDVAVTFDPELFDARPATLRLLSFGEETLDEILHECPQPDPGSENTGGLLRFEVDAPAPLRAYVALTRDGLRRIDSLAELRTYLEAPPGAAWSTREVDAAKQAFLALVEERRRQAEAIEQGLRKAEELALEERGRQVLLRAALIELALAQQPGLFEEPSDFSFSSEAVQRLRRHGYPFAGLLRWVNTTDLRPSPADPFYVRIQEESPATVRGRFAAVRGEAEETLRQLGAFKRATAEVATAEDSGGGRIRSTLLRLPDDVSAT